MSRSSHFHALHPAMQCSVEVEAIAESLVTCVKVVSTQKSNSISRFRQALGQVRPPIGSSVRCRENTFKAKWQAESGKNSFSKITRKIEQLKPYNVLNTDRKPVFLNRLM